MKQLSIFLFLCLLLACEREVDLVAPPYSSKIVVNGLLSNENVIRVSVGFSVVALSTDEPGYLSDAVVEIWEDGVSLGFGVYDVFDKVYQWTQVPKQGSKYRVQVRHPDYPMVDQTLIMPTANAFGNLEYRDSIGLDTSGQALASITVVINDPAAEQNFYRLNFLYYNDVTAGFLPFTFETSDAVLLSPATVKEDDGAYLFSDELFNSGTRQITIEFTRDIAQSTPRFLVIGESLSKELYKYQVSLDKFEEAKDNPFLEPVLVYSNIHAGLGIWAGKIAERDTIY